MNSWKTERERKENSNRRERKRERKQARCSRGYRLKANDQISQISLIENIRNMVGIKFYLITLNNKVIVR